MDKYLAKFNLREKQFQKTLRSKLISVVWTNHDKEITNESNEMKLYYQVRKIASKIGMINDFKMTSAKHLIPFIRQTLPLPCNPRYLDLD